MDPFFMHLKILFWRSLKMGILIRALFMVTAPQRSQKKEVIVLDSVVKNIKKSEKIVAFCDRHCNVLSPMVRAAGNRHESPLFPEALSFLKSVMKRIGSTVSNCVMSLDTAYDSKVNRTEGQRS